MATDDRGAAPATRQQPFRLYAAQGHVYARNRDNKLIDLGTLTHHEGGICYLLDGNGQGGSGFFTEEEALRDIAGHLHFLWLDGQFTAVGDAGAETNLEGATQLDIVLDELAPAERITDATV